MILGNQTITAIRIGSTPIASARRGGVTVWSGVHPDALAYSNTTGLALDSPQVVGLSGFIKEVETEGIDLEWLVLGRSEFNARDGSTYRSVIGPNGTVAGTVVDAEAGIVFDGAGRVDFANPLKSATLGNLYVLAHAGSDEAVLSGGAKAIWSAYQSSSDRGAELCYVAAAGIGAATDEVVMSISPNNASHVTRASGFRQHVPGVKKMSGFVFSGTNPAGIITTTSGNPGVQTNLVAKDLYITQQTNQAAQIYNDGTTWSIGNRPVGGAAFTGELDMIVAGNHPLSEVQRDTIQAAALRHGLIQTTQPKMLIFVGDSMTDGSAGGVPVTAIRTHQISHSIPSGWSGGLFTQIAQGGAQPEVQQSFWDRARGRFNKFPATVDKTVFFWGGYNAYNYLQSDPAAMEALAELYIAMGLDAVANGVRPIHWSATQSSDRTAEQIAGINHFNDYYASRCAAEGMIFYDHRLTFDLGEFDSTPRTGAFFVDIIHLSAAGQAAMCKDFVARFPGPMQAWDADAANYIARIVQQGANPTTAQRETINAWYLAEKLAGTYDDLRDVYLPVWGVANANRVNLITGQMDATIVGDVIHGAGFVQSNMAGTPGYFNLGHTPTAIGMTPVNCYLAGLILGEPAVNSSVLGQYQASVSQHMIRTVGATRQYGMFSGAGGSGAKATNSVAAIQSGSATGASGNIFLAERTSTARNIVATAPVAGGNPAANLNIYALCRNALGNPAGFHEQEAGFWVTGLGKDEAEDERFTLGMKNLWEGVTGLAIP